MSCRSIMVIALGIVLAARAGSAADPITVVQPAELTKHPDWAGREVAVEDRVKYFQHHQGRGFDELLLERTEVVFRLPENLRPERNGGIPVARVQGILRREGNQWFCDVSALTALPRDIDRLEKAVAPLAPYDYPHRAAWARWAIDRAEAFQDRELRERGLRIEEEAIDIEADRTETHDRPALWLRLAQRARDHGIPEPFPSALAHRAFRSRLPEAKTSAQLDQLAADIEAFLPRSKDPQKGQIEPASWATAYAANPGEAYRHSPDRLRRVFDRQLLADVLQRSLERRAAEQPGQAMALADQANTRLPDRPEVAERLRAQGREAAANNVASLRLADLEQLAHSFEEAGDPDRAERLKRQWLDDQRLHRLSPTDSEGRVRLGRQYAELVHDDAMATALYQEAAHIDPKNRQAEKALKSAGYRKVGDSWVKRTAARNGSDGDDSAEDDRGGSRDSGSLEGLTRQEVRGRLGKPDYIARVGTQGQVVEQWIYEGLKGTQYINFVKRPTSMRATVESHFSLSGTAGRR